MRHDHTPFRHAARLTFAATALTLFALPCFAETKTIFAPGVTIDSGWYDVNKKSTETVSQIDFVACWGAAASNMLQYWQDTYTAAGNILPEGTPNGVGTKEYAEGKGTYELAIFEQYLDHWESTGGDPLPAIQWYLNGYVHNTTGVSKPTSGNGGFFSDEYDSIVQVCGSDCISCTQKFDDNGGWGSESSQQALSVLSEHIISILEEGVGSIVIKPATILHSITLWGAEVNENNQLTAVYITDSDDALRGGSSDPLRRYSVAAGSSAGSVQLLETDYGSVEITKIYGLTAYPIPEPSAFGLLAGVFALVFGASRRHRK